MITVMPRRFRLPPAAALALLAWLCALAPSAALAGGSDRYRIGAAAEYTLSEHTFANYDVDGDVNQEGSPVSGGLVSGGIFCSRRLGAGCSASLVARVGRESFSNSISDPTVLDQNYVIQLYGLSLALGGYVTRWPILSLSGGQGIFPHWAVEASGYKIYESYVDTLLDYSRWLPLDAEVGLMGGIGARLVDRLDFTADLYYPFVPRILHLRQTSALYHQGLQVRTSVRITVASF